MSKKTWQSTEIRQAFRGCSDRKKYEARLLRRSVNGAFGKEKANIYNQMVIGTREVERVVV